MVKVPSAAAVTDCEMTTGAGLMRWAATVTLLTAVAPTAATSLPWIWPVDTAVADGGVDCAQTLHPLAPTIADNNPITLTATAIRMRTRTPFGPSIWE
jgi:hypothetical protein